MNSVTYVGNFISSHLKLFTFQKMAVTRIYVVISVCLSLFAFAFDPMSRLGESAIFTQASFFWIFPAIVLSLFAILDLIINDIAPQRFYIKWLCSYRHLTYMFLSLLSFSLSVALTETYGASFLMGRLWLDGTIAALVAFLDIIERYRGFRESAIHINTK